MVLSNAERVERAAARALLREALRLLKRAGVTQNDIARVANYSQGYIPVLLSESADGERLNPAAVTRMLTAINALAGEASFRLGAEDRAGLTRVIEELTAGYGSAAFEISHPGERLTPRTSNWLRRDIDDDLQRELIDKSKPPQVIGITGGAGTGKTWALQRMASAAEPSHLVFSLNLSDAGNADSGERIVQLLEQFALRQPTQVPAEHALGMGADVSPLVKALAKLNGHARASGKGLLVTIDLPRVKALELRLFFGVADLGTNQWRFGGALDGVTVVLAGDHLNDTIGSGHKSPIYDTKPLSNDEVTSLTTIWLTSTQNGFVDVALDVASQIGGNPHLLATYLHSLRHVRAGSQSVTAGVDNAELARVVQRHLLRAVADVCSDEFVSDARSAVEAWFAGPLDPIDFNAAYMFRAAKRHGIGNSVDGAPLPWIAEGRQFSRFGLESSAWAERIVSVRSPLPAHLLT